VNLTLRQRALRASLRLAWVVAVTAAFLSGTTGRTQPHDKAWADKALDSLNLHVGKDNEAALDIADMVSAIYAKHKDTCGLIRARVYAAKYLDALGKTDSAVGLLLGALYKFTPACDSTALMEIYTNLSSAYISLGDFNRVDSICRVALADWPRNASSSDLRFALLTNQAIAMASLGDLDGGYRQFRNMMMEARSLGDVPNMETALINMGTIWSLREVWDSAFVYFFQALESLENRHAYQEEVELKINLAAVQHERGRSREALVLLDEVEAEARSRSDLLIRSKVAQSKATTYRDMGDHKSAVQQYEIYVSLRDSVLNEERIRSVNEMQEKFETEKKKREIQDLQVKNLDAQLATERVRRGRNLLYAGGGMLALALFFLVSRYRIVHRNRNVLREKNLVIEHEKQRSDGLLRNILPDEVAEELKQYGRARARHFDLVSIYFSDFRSFTQVTEQLSAQELVEELDACFQAFDAIVTTYHLEKIKTIGDAYMAAAGLPVSHPRDAQHMIDAALDMQQFMKDRKRQRSAAGLLTFEMRAGIHSGPVVAGVVGAKKFQYDVWGDTVNLASRMETSGEVGEVNISEATYNLVRGVPHFHFEHRGKVTAKNKGELDMYFVRRIGPPT
jgi:class 3 adenylate cyclase